MSGELHTRKMPAMFHRFHHRAMPLVLSAIATVLAAPACADEVSARHAFTVYAARISAQDTWHDVLIHPFSTNYTDSYLVAGSWSRAYNETHDGALRKEMEVNVAYNFGEQNHWELNVVPITLRWQRFPWSARFHSTVAFGLGLSYAFDRPIVEQELENDTQRLLLYWMIELTAGPRDGPWSAVLRLHHRSPGWGVMGVADGGMNAPGIGFRYQF